ncbi:MAG: DDE-type integrase/transposase/recombinase, partial [Magnetococcus sp. YQC-3]
ALSSNPRLLKRELAKRFKIRNVSVEKISDWLSGQFSHQIHRRAEIKFKRNPVISPDLDYQWQADLLFLDDELGRFNKGYKVGLVVVDVVSRFGWVELMKNKTGTSTTEAFEKILARASPRKPVKLQTDNGKEFLNKNFQDLMKKNGITFFTTYSDTKASIAERLIQTIKKMVYKYLNNSNTK